MATQFQPSKRASYSPPGGDGYLSTGSPTPSPTLALSPFDHPNKLATTASEAASASHPAMDVSSVAISKDEGDSPNGNGMNSASSPTGSASGLMMPGDQNLIPQISIRALIPVKVSETACIFFFFFCNFSFCRRSGQLLVATALSSRRSAKRPGQRSTSLKTFPVRSSASSPSLAPSSESQRPSCSSPSDSRTKQHVCFFRKK